jgi:hypothetical protein
MSTNPYETPNASNASSSQQPRQSRSPAIAVVHSILGVIGGVVAAGVVVGVMEFVGHKIYPPPPGIDLHNPEALKTIIDQLPLGAIVMVLVAWGAGSLVGGFTAGAVAGRAQVVHGLIVGGIQMAFGILTMIMIPHPVWFMIAAVVVVIPPAWLGAVVARLLFDPSPPAGPKPYDMRQKNMAC